MRYKDEESVLHLRMTQDEGFFKGIFHPGVSFFLKLQTSMSSLMLEASSLLTNSMLVNNHLPFCIDTLVKPQGSFSSTRSPFLIENRNPDS